MKKYYPMIAVALIFTLSLLCVLSCCRKAQASEGGASVYLLGSGAAGAAILPPVEGIFFDNVAYYYDGSASGGKQFSVGGNVVAGLDATIIADFATVLWVPTTDFAGGTFTIGASLPAGYSDVDVSAVITGPAGNTFGLSASDSATVIGDPIIASSLGWKDGNMHYTVSGLLNVPVGDYREDELANLAFHRWAFDTSFAVTWNDPVTGWDVSGKTGVTFNGENQHTDYDTGNEFHIEAAVEKKLSPSWSMGPQVYYFKQITDDSGSGDSLGAFKGEVAGFGGSVAYNFEAGNKPATLRLRALKEFDAENRLEGNSVWLEFSVPLSMNIPGKS